MPSGGYRPPQYRYKDMHTYITLLVLHHYIHSMRQYIHSVVQSGPKWGPKWGPNRVLNPLNRGVSVV